MKIFLTVLLILVFFFPGYAKECYKLLYVIDGYTLVILYQDHKTKVRLLGIDTPESRENRRAYYQAQGKTGRMLTNCLNAL